MEDSDDSELEGVLTNVVRAIMRPPGHSGKAKRGHLCFDASFETGNLGRIDFVSEHEYDLLIRPDTSNPRFRFWFNFNVDNAQAGQLAIFNIVNFHKENNLFSEGLTPLVRSTSRPGWDRIPKDQVYYHRSMEHREGHLILSFSFCFDIETDVYQFALSYPYSYTRIQTFLAYLESKNLASCRRSCIAQSVMKRRCELLTITSPKNMIPAVVETCNHISLEVVPGLPYARPSENGLLFDDNKEKEEEKEKNLDAKEDGENISVDKGREIISDNLDDHCEQRCEDSTSRSSIPSTPTSQERETKRVVVILARSHPAESPTSFIVQGMIEMLSGENDVANRLLKKVVFKIIPMLNPDGVFLGNYRSSLMGADLNRRWGTASPYAHPTIHATKQMILELNNAEWCELDLVLDLHTTNTQLGTFIYGNSYDDVYRHERHIVFPKMVSHACEDYAPENSIYNRDPNKSQSARRWLCNNLKDSVNVYSIHTSFLGFTKSKNEPMILYTQDSYVRVGRSLSRAILDYYQFLGIIPFSLPDALPLHDLPRLRPGSPVSSDSHTKNRISSALSSSYRGRGRRTHYFSDGDIERKSESSGHLEIFLESDSGNSDNSESEDDCQSDSSNFRIHVVKHPASSSDEPNGKLGDDSKSKSGRSSFLSRASTKGTASRLLTSTTHVQLYPNEVLKDDTNKLPDLPSMKASFSRLTLQDKDSTSDQTKIKKKNKKSKSLTWVEPSSGNSSLSFRYFDFRRMTRPKTRKRRSRKRSKSLSNSRSRSRSRSRRRLRKPKLKKNRKKVTSSISLEKEKKSGESIKESKKKLKKSVSLNIPKQEEIIKSDKTLEIINFDSPSTKGFHKKS